MIRRVLDYYYRLLQALLTFTMFAILVPVSMQILSRYVDVVPRYIWTEEIARTCFIWIVMIGAIIAVRDGSHFDVDLLPKIESHRIEGLVRILTHLLMGVLAIVFVYYGYFFYEIGTRTRSAIAALPMVYINTAWLIAGVSWLLFLAEKLHEDVQILKGARRP
jgi:TRAP-type transport system small permease protein